MAASSSLSLEKLLERKIELERELDGLEQQIYDLEGSYLDDTQQFGNILRGWDAYFSAGRSNQSGSRKGARESDRIFSLSSVTAPVKKDE